MKWQERNGLLLSQEPIAPGVYRVKDQPTRYYLRKRVTSQKTGKQVEIAKTIEAPTLGNAIDQLDELVQKARKGEQNQDTKVKFSAYATALLERKLQQGKLKEKLRRGKEGIASLASLETWNSILKHHLLPRFGDYYITAITRSDILDYKKDLEKEVAEGTLAASTANARLTRLCCIIQAAVAELELEKNPTLKIGRLPEVSRYTRDEPNALTPELAEKFLGRMHRMYPHHFAFYYLMYVLGLRPSSIRPLRCRGPQSDILWEEGILLVRRSHSRGQVVMNMTKTGQDQEFPLPPEVLEILKWHIQEFHSTKRQLEGELLFCSPQGNLLHPAILTWSCNKVSEALGIKFRLTPKGAGRRTNTSVNQAAGASAAEAALLTGHQSGKMVALYTDPGVKLAKQREGIARVVSLADWKKWATAARTNVSGNGMGNEKEKVGMFGSTKVKK